MPKDNVQNNQEPTQEELLEAQKALKSATDLKTV